MGKARNAYGLVLSALAKRIHAGAYAPGAYISIGRIAQEYRTSATPVREALARLTGEGLVQDARGRGYAFLSFDALHLGELYALHQAYMAWAATHLRPVAAARRLAPAVRDLQAGGETEQARCAFVFQALVNAAGNRVVSQEHTKVLGRLGAPHRVEIDLMDPDERDVDVLATLIDAVDSTAIQAWIAKFQKAREAILNDVALVLRSDLGPENQMRVVPKSI